MSKTKPGRRASRHTKSPAGRQTSTRRWPVIVVVIVVAAGLAAYYISRGEATDRLPAAIAVAPGAAADFNVVLFTLDTLRADHVGCYGYDGVATPRLDTLAADGVRFADAVTAFPVTLPAHCTIMTGNYPPVHGVRDNGTYRLAERHETLAERLKAAGYATAAFVGSFVLDRRYGLDQGFDVYDDDITMRYRTPGEPEPANPQRPGNVVIDSAVAWLDQHRQARFGQPFFMWIHLFDPHTPYTPPEPFQTRYASSPYDGEIAFTDQQVGRFLDRLREHALLDRTVVVVVGDHGEGLGEHGELEHGLLIYGSTMRVPLIFCGSGIIPSGRVVGDRVVGIVDIAPTILDLLGLELGRCDGVSLLRATTTAERALYMETLYPKLHRGWSPLHAVRRHADKYILAPTPEYYDLRADPRESRNLAGSGQVEAQALAARLKEMMSSFPPEEEARDATVTPDAEALRKLAALGYVGGEVVTDGPLPDPKEMILRWQPQLQALRELVRQARFAEAVPLVEEALESTPTDPELWLLLSEVQAKLSRLEGAAASRRRAIELQGGRSADDWVQLARLHYAAGDVEAGRVSLSEAEALDPDHGEIALTRAQRALDDGRYEDALQLCAEARRRDAARCTARSWSLQGEVYERMGRAAEAKAAFERAYEADRLGVAGSLRVAENALREGQFDRVRELAQQVPFGHARWVDAQTLVARACLGLAQGPQAVRIMQDVVDRKPRDARAHNNLGSVLQELRRFDDAAAAYETAIGIDPGYATAHFNLALVRKEQGLVEQALQHLRKAVELQPTWSEAVCELASTLGDRGEVEEAIELLRQGHRLLPEDPAIANHLAWILATSANEKIRDGAEAVEIAEAVNESTGGRYSSVLDTLAAAYAEVGRFDEAVATAVRGLELARHANEDELVAAIEARLNLYRRHQAYREP